MTVSRKPGRGPSDRSGKPSPRNVSRRKAGRLAVLLFDNVEVMDFARPFEVFGATLQREGKRLFDAYIVA